MVEEVRRDPATGETVVVRRTGGGSGWIIFLLLLVALAALAYFTGFLNVNPGQAPKISVSGGQAPTVETGKLVVGTKPTTVDVPKVETKKEQVDVPVVGVQKAPGADANK